MMESSWEDIEELANSSKS